MTQFQIIQGGMGVAVSGWRLARNVSQLGQLGVVSGTAIDVVVARRLQIGDPVGHLRRAFDHFPFPDVAARVWERYFVLGGKPDGLPFRPVPLHSLHSPASLVELTVLANFVEVWLAKEGHSGVVGINFLEKIQLPTLPSLYGAMLAGVDYILMGAGIPRSIPGILDDLALGKAVNMKVEVEGAQPGDEFSTTFDPAQFGDVTPRKLARPKFLAIISSATLALTLARKSNGRVDGFVVEGASAGGHNAPPRGPLHLSERGEPVYGERDLPDLEKIKAIGLPFWLAGSYGQPGKLAEALRLGAAGVQVGTAFAFCEESGVTPEIERRILQKGIAETLTVFTDPLASPTGFPFKILQVEGSISESDETRERVCDLGYLRHLYRRENGTVGYRCPGESLQEYARKGGDIAETEGRKCVCNGLMATIGLPQMRGDFVEKPLITAGDDVRLIVDFLQPGKTSYTASDVIERLLV